MFEGVEPPRRIVSYLSAIPTCLQSGPRYELDQIVLLFKRKMVLRTVVITEVLTWHCSENPGSTAGASRE
jgi:hypothetical protein